MATTTSRFWFGVGVTAEMDTPYASSVTLSSKCLNTCTFNLVGQASSGDWGNSTNGCQFSGSGKTSVYLCDSDGENEVFVETLQSPITLPRSNSLTLTISSLRGKTLYVKLKRVSGNLNVKGDLAFTISYDTYTNCTAPTDVTVSRVRGKVTIEWSGMSGGTNNSITGFTLIRNTSASTSGATTVSNSLGASTTSTTNSPSAGSYYYGVRTKATYNNSSYKWSSQITVPSKPTVAIGDDITKTQMDDLKTWINNSSLPSVTQYDNITATQGTQYGSVSAGNDILASWYNAIADG